MELRPYQHQVVGEIYRAWEKGAINVLVQMATGSGKTVVFSKIISENLGYSIAIAHRVELVSQISLTLARYGVRHNIVAQKSGIREMVAIHMAELGRSYYDQHARCTVAGVDTLLRLDRNTPWFSKISLVVQDEGHHPLRDNKWGTAASLFPKAKGLYPTATPLRADGKGLGRHADGLMDVLIEGPTMRDLINMGYLTDYRIFAPPSDLDLSTVPLSAGGDFSPPKLRNAVHKSHITGDVVNHYLKIAPGKLGVTFAVDIEAATEIAKEFRAAGVTAEVISSKTPDLLRAAIMGKFRRREILQLVNVDLLGEGVDVPAIEVISMARPTESYALYCLDPETEVLTPRGWEKAETALQAKEVIAFDLIDDSSKIVSVDGRVCREIYKEEKLYSLEGPHLNLLISDKHDLIIKGTSKTCVNWQKKKAQEISIKKSMVRVPVSANGSFLGSGLKKCELEFLGWFLSDGGLNKITNGISICQAINKIEHLDSIRKAIKECGFKFNERKIVRKNCPSTHNDLIQFTISKGKPRKKDFHLTGWDRLGDWINKDIPAIYDSLTRHEFMILLSTLNLGDGVNNHRSLDYVKNTLTITCGDNIKMADRIQALCVQRGLRCNKAIAAYPNKKEWHILHIRDCLTSTIAGVNNKNGKISNKKSYKRSRLVESEIRPDFVWCLSNKLGTLITRRKGKVIIIGNCQQFGRSLRPMDGKTHAIIIDHVSNTLRHGLPDAPKKWSLDRRDRRSRNTPSDVIPLRTCLNAECLAVYERVYRICPMCGFYSPPMARSTPEQVDGDLLELDAETLARLRGEIKRIDSVARIPQGLTHFAQIAVGNRHLERQNAQYELREKIALWAGHLKIQDLEDSEIYRRFYFSFKIDIATAQTLNTNDADELYDRVNAAIDAMGNTR